MCRLVLLARAFLTTWIICQALENHWREQTVPKIREVVASEMDVPADSPRIAYNPDVDDKYRYKGPALGDIRNFLYTRSY